MAYLGENRGVVYLLKQFLLKSHQRFQLTLLQLRKQKFAVMEPPNEAVRSAAPRTSERRPRSHELKQGRVFARNDCTV